MGTIRSIIPVYIFIHASDQQQHLFDRGKKNRKNGRLQQQVLFSQGFTSHQSLVHLLLLIVRFYLVYKPRVHITYEKIRLNTHISN
jgi:hypothetical protein